MMPETFDLYDPRYSELDGMEYFYDGELPIRKGHILVPKSQTVWVQRLLHLNWIFAHQDDADEYLAAVD